MSRDFTIIDCAQRSAEWFAARAGRVTGSKAKIVLMGAKTDGRASYLEALAYERMSGQVDVEPVFTRDMAHGVEEEGWGREIIEVDYGVIIRQTGFCQHNRLMIGMSYDGDIGDFTSFVEIKMPKRKTLFEYMRGKVLPAEYRAQVMHGHYVSGARHAIFCSGRRGLLPGLDRFYVETDAEQLPMAEYEKALLTFLDQVSDMEAELRLLQQGKL